MPKLAGFPRWLRVRRRAERAAAEALHGCLPHSAGGPRPPGPPVQPVGTGKRRSLHGACVPRPRSSCWRNRRREWTSAHAQRSTTWSGTRPPEALPCWSVPATTRSSLSCATASWCTARSLPPSRTTRSPPPRRRMPRSANPLSWKGPDRPARDLRSALTPRNISAAYVLIGLIAIFGFLRPDTFLT